MLSGFNKRLQKNLNFKKKYNIFFNILFHLKVSTKHTKYLTVLFNEMKSLPEGTQILPFYHQDPVLDIHLIQIQD